MLERSSGLKNVIETGEMIQSRIKKEILISIFNPKSPLHDGATILKNGKIEASRCLLPLSEPEKIRNKNLGTRHRAGIGITEVSDAVSIIVSEERKTISVVEDGKLTYYKDENDLKEILIQAMGKTSVANSVKNIFEESDTNFDKKEKPEIKFDDEKEDSHEESAEKKSRE